LLTPHFDQIFAFIKKSHETNESDDVLKGIVGLIGDMGQTFGKKVGRYLREPFIAAAIQEANGYQDDEGLQQLVRWAYSEVVKATN
jgi:hypothetical protein